MPREAEFAAAVDIQSGKVATKPEAKIHDVAMLLAPGTDYAHGVGETYEAAVAVAKHNAASIRQERLLIERLRSIKGKVA